MKVISDNHKRLRGPVPLSHLLLRQFVRAGDNVIDATCGNGHDTLLLAELATADGTVWGFDIQIEAIQATAQKLTAAGFGKAVRLFHCSHAQMTQYVDQPIHAVVFNLGYLPGGDRSLTTRPETTLAALEQSLKLLHHGGIIMATIYPGHDGGDAEGNAVEAWAAGLSPKHCHVWRMGQTNVKVDAPYLILIQKAVM